MAHIASSKIREIFGRQGLQRKLRAARRQCYALALAILFNLNFCTIGQFAHNVMQKMGWHGHSAWCRNARRRLLNNFTLQIGCLEFQGTILRRQQHIGQNRNGRAALYDTGHMAECPKQFTAFNHKPHKLMSQVFEMKRQFQHGGHL